MYMYIHVRLMYMYSITHCISLGPNTLHCSVDGLELFSCCLSHEDKTALSILDPVSVGVELKPLTANNISTERGTHMLEVISYGCGLYWP